MKNYETLKSMTGVYDKYADDSWCYAQFFTHVRGGGLASHVKLPVAVMQFKDYPAYVESLIADATAKGVELSFVGCGFNYSSRDQIRC